MQRFCILELPPKSSSDSRTPMAPMRLRLLALSASRGLTVCAESPAAAMQDRPRLAENALHLLGQVRFAEAAWR